MCRTTQRAYNINYIVVIVFSCTNFSTVFTYIYIHLGMFSFLTLYMPLWWENQRIIASDPNRGRPDATQKGDASCEKCTCHARSCIDYDLPWYHRLYENKIKYSLGLYLDSIYTYIDGTRWSFKIIYNNNNCAFHKVLTTVRGWKNWTIFP